MRSRSVIPHLRARAFSSSLRNTSRPLNCPPTQRKAAAAKHAFGRAALAHIHVDRGVLVGNRDHARHVAIADQHHPRSRARAVRRSVRRGAAGRARRHLMSAGFTPLASATAITFSVADRARSMMPSG